MPMPRTKRFAVGFPVVFITTAGRDWLLPVSLVIRCSTRGFVFPELSSVKPGPGARLFAPGGKLPLASAAKPTAYSASPTLRPIGAYLRVRRRWRSIIRARSSPPPSRSTCRQAILGEALTAIQQTMAHLNVPIAVHGDSPAPPQLSGNRWPTCRADPGRDHAIYIVLGVLYESYIHPLTILSTLPSAGVGAVLALLVFQTEFGLIAFIGVILLIGIVKKNAIMMIDFAIDAERARGPDSARGDLSRLPAALPPHHDDHHGRASWARCRWRSASARVRNCASRWASPSWAGCCSARC